MSYFYLKDYIIAQVKEIEIYKWIKSEELGYDIGKDRAVEEWRLKHSDSFRDYWLMIHPCPPAKDEKK